MKPSELEHLTLLAEVDQLLAELRRWASDAPDWPPSRQAQALLKRLIERTDTLRLRWEAPLVVATLGGTGTGKSSLVNAIVGEEVTVAGRQRPTTRVATLICRPDLTAELLGFDPQSVHLVQRDLPALRDLVLLDCPDPDTTEDEQEPGTNLDRLRHLLPHCDVLLVTGTQQKYRSARVAAELAAAAPGARLVFVQTHADTDDDIRDDWQRVLGGDYQAGEMFFVDSVAALADQKAGVQPRGQFAQLLDLLTRQLASTAAHRIRRANFLDLLQETLIACRQQIDEASPAVEQLKTAIIEKRAELAARLSSLMYDELIDSRRSWENRLLGEAASRWGFSPFACVLRLYHGIGALLSSAWLLRVRTPAQLALWGAVEGARRWRAKSQERQAEAGGLRAVSAAWDDGELRTAAIIVDGYAAEAGLPRNELHGAELERLAGEAGAQFVERCADQLQGLIARLAARHTGWLTRCFYELAWLTMVALLLYRFGRNFFWDSWLAAELGFYSQPAPLLGFDFFLGAAIILVVWSALLLWLFTSRLRRGLRGELRELTAQWNNPSQLGGLFASLERRVGAIRAWQDDLERLDKRVSALQENLQRQPSLVGHRVRK